MRRLFFGIFCIPLTLFSSAQIQVSSDKHYLTKDGKPFFWLGDTAWELFHRLNREEAKIYLKNRADRQRSAVHNTFKKWKKILK
jgi:hypothetical protein